MHGFDQEFELSGKSASTDITSLARTKSVEMYKPA